MNDHIIEQPAHVGLSERMLAMRDEAQSLHLMRFFRTAPGQYGAGDRFLGIRVPQTRALVREYRMRVTADDIPPLTASPFHEIRLAGFLLLIEIYNRFRKKGDEKGRREAVDLYMSLIERGNNWDLVDLGAPRLLGDWLADHPSERDILDRLADMEGRLWHQRVAMVSTLALICGGEYADTFRIAGRLLTHTHDLIHKATGWMLREVGKRGGRSELVMFLNTNAARMPRTALRYAIEHFTPEERRRYLDM